MAQSSQNYYTNPAFSQQSEFYNSRQQIHQHSRQSPVGAQTAQQYRDQVDDENGNFDEQEFYEEMLVDDCGAVKQKKVVVISSSPNNLLERGGGDRTNRYEYIPMQEQNSRYVVLTTKKPHTTRQVMMDRYEMIEANDNNMIVPHKPQTHRYEYIQEPDYSPGNRYEYITTSSPQQQISPPKQRLVQQQQQQQYPSSPPRRLQGGGNPIATQKLHQLLSTPKKTPIMSPQSARRSALPSSTSSPARDPFITPPKKPRAQQKLNYAIGAMKQHQSVQKNAIRKSNNMAVVAPRCASPIQSVYSETTFSHKTESWMNLNYLNPKGLQKPTQVTLGVAAFMMMLCGGLTSGLCFYMVSILGRLYFLDFGIVAGFTCLVLGLLGFRTRNCYWLPNRNYISGYILLSVFSLLMCAGLLVLLVMQPRPGTPLADMTSGAVCGISVLSIVLASVGVMSSYCCKYPPPDNRVHHSVPGFTV